ncbi:precorrin-3B C(17)-methyltransferase [Pseudomonas sp. K1(2024)]|uniref:Precorrin-3B C(17)-methyltransferase n=1 Tax=Pseudomonas boreofloridensis TaxID=3064348 RepID=A0ABV4ZF67_9PSED|nr:precorrin-3B C(17)-methyltransferase [Pseudomonas sp. K13]MDO7904477.1 precorrin-3B C(17)-methyltransferase [Pseudomonas sp. K13]
MAGMNTQAMAIVVLGQGSLATARRLQQRYPQARIHGLSGRVEGVDHLYASFGDTLRALYRAGVPIIALCAAGIVIRSLAAVLDEKGSEPPVLAVAEDGSAVVPLLGGLSGVNGLARELGEALGVAAAITTSGELRFGTCLLNPPPGYALADLEQGKRFVSDLLAGEPLRIEGAAPWLAQAPLTQADDARLTLHVGCTARPASRDELLIHPRSVLVAVDETQPELARRVREALAAANIAQASLACLLASEPAMAEPAVHAAARELGVILRFAPAGVSVSERAQQALAGAQVIEQDGLAIAIAAAPFDAQQIGRGRGRLAVIGLGPGAAELMVPAVKAELARAEDVLGYETYVRMAGPFRDDQVLHCTDNREEMQRARHAFALAAQGRSVVVVSSGDPGVFAMAAAVLEALHESDDPAWHRVELQILPGVSASLATAAQAGAPLGHDFCVLSLSDNLKPWSIIETRLDLAAQADLVLAFYNPISKARPWQLGQALDVVRRHRDGRTPVVLGRDIGRPGQTLKVVTLAELLPEMVDMRTMVLVGSSTTCVFQHPGGVQWVYTPRWYPPHG